MARVAVIGEPLRIHGYGLPDAILCPATDQAEAVLAWRDLPDDIDVAVLTPSAARWLASVFGLETPGVLPDDDAGRHWIEFRVGNCSLIIARLAGDRPEGVLAELGR